VAHSVDERVEKFGTALVHLDLHAGGVPPFVINDLASAGIVLVCRQCKTPAEVVEIAEGADVVWIASSMRIITGEVLKRLPGCCAILRSGSGTDNIPVEAATRLGIVVVNTPAAVADPVADHTIALMLAAARWVTFHDRSMRSGVWTQFQNMPLAPMRGRTLGLVGFGMVARCVQKKISGFELRILAYDPYVSTQEMREFGVQKASLEELLHESDFVSLHCPLTTETHHLIGEARLRQMKTTAILVNMARGAVVDEAALVRALKEREIAAAAMDVYETEPLPVQSRLIGLDNVVLSPHLAANTRWTFEEMFRLAVRSIVDLAEGKWPASCVNRRQVNPRVRLE
jgi:D-3-phosphoglycerate dehydrogenase